jgi:hypothetical protein
MHVVQMANLCTQRTEVKQNHDTGNVLNTGKGGARKKLNGAESLLRR